MFPALRNIPDHYEAMVNEDCGVVMARKAIEAVSKLAKDKYGAKFLFKTKVTDVTKNSIITEDGFEYTAEHVVISAGPHSHEMFDKSSKARRVEVEYYVFQDKSGLPGGYIEMADNGVEYYGMLDGPNLDRYKMGENIERNLASMMKFLNHRMPDKLDTFLYAHPCYFSWVDSEEFQYKTDEKGIHFAYGFSGTGFKFLPLHGKIVYDGLLNKFDQGFIPEKFRAKM